MSTVARLLLLVFGFASLQLSLLAGGPGCPMPGGDAAGTPTAGMTMAGMTMANDVGTGAPDVAPAGDRAQGAPPRGLAEDAPCDESAAPQACESMAPCLFAVLAPASRANACETRTPTAEIVALVLTPPSATSAPELPPPRA